MKRFLILLLFSSTQLFAQHDGCDKCSMLQEEYEAAVSPEKEKIYAFFKQECLQTDTVFVSDQGVVQKAEVATNMKVVDKGKCIDYQIVKEYVKATKKETRSYSVSKKDTVYTFASTQPVFPGGDVELMKYLSKNIQYPAKAAAEEIQGTVYLQFVVTKNGTVGSVKAIRSPNAELTTEAIRVVKSMPKWTPATYKNEPVSMRFVLPVKFKLK
ncbi:MAG TPA: energy transducer TonB [Bacteroidia bacterium]|nr:energy transducer TonB [Bacteroidia bacterium]